jgi:excisionase family DNA binding protein
MEVSRSLQLLDVRAAAQLLGLTENAVRALVFRRMLPYRKHGRRVLFLEHELQAYMGTLPGVSVEEARQRVRASTGGTRHG